MKERVFLNNNQDGIVEKLYNAFFECRKRVNKWGSLYRNYFYSNFILKSSARLALPKPMNFILNAPRISKHGGYLVLSIR